MKSEIRQSLSILKTTTMVAGDTYPEIRKYLEVMSRQKTGRGIGLLGVIAARAKVAEGDLREIVEEGRSISDEIAAAVAGQIGEE